MKKRTIKKRISAAINGRVKTGAEYFWPRTSDCRDTGGSQKAKIIDPAPEATRAERRSEK